MLWIVATLVVVLVAAVLAGRWVMLDRQRKARLGPLAERLQAETSPREPRAGRDEG